MATIIKTGLIRDEDTLVGLDVIDFGRDNGGVFGGPHLAVNACGMRTIGTMTYTIIDHGNSTYPDRDDFPGWSHAGYHTDVARQYWNKFMARYPDSTLRFHDSPDFSGKIVLGNMLVDFWGDIGMVSPIAFFETVKNMRPGDLWVTIAENREIVLETQLAHPLVQQLYMPDLTPPFNATPQTASEVCEWLKKRGYDINWTDREYASAYRNYLQKHRRRPKSEIVSDADCKVPTALYQLAMF